MILRSILRSVVGLNRTTYHSLCGNFNEKLSAGISKMYNTTFEEHVFNTKGRKLSSLVEYIHDIDSKRIDDEYEAAIKALNGLQSNALTIRQSAATNSRLHNIDNTIKYLERSGLSLQDVEKLSFIHVAGTKGKGSTCALTESILRAHGARTGFFSSPHLVSITERIRINGAPIAKQKFTRAFWHVFKRLEAAKEFPDDMPAYFKILTIIAFHIFIDEKVDVVVLEVGIGGELDCTNIIRNTRTVGITSLGLEHTQLLGSTLREIAWQKAGIIKQRSNVYTHVTQPECLEVIAQRTAEKNATLHITPPFADYIQRMTEINKSQFNALNDIVHLNGSLAIQLSYDWLRNSRNGLHCNYAINSTQMSVRVLRGLYDCHWPGRCQIVDYANYKVHIDGAHTDESMSVCSSWFQKVTNKSEHPKVLIFNRTGNTDSKKLLEILRNLNEFDTAYFVPNIVATRSSNRKDIVTRVYADDEQLKRAGMHADNWRQLCIGAGVPNNGLVFPSVLDAFEALRRHYATKPLNVLVTGSLHLIGAAICALNEFDVTQKERE